MDSRHVCIFKIFSPAPQPPNPNPAYLQPYLRASTITPTTEMRDDKEHIREHRINNAVGDIGVIETGLCLRRNASKKSLDSLARPGLCTLIKCRARPSLAKRLKLLRNCVTRSSSTEGDVALLHAMKLNIPEGSITAILGTADSGKSTLLKFLAGCLDRNVEWDGIGTQRIFMCAVDWLIVSHRFLSQSARNKILQPARYYASWIYTQNIYKAL